MASNPELSPLLALRGPEFFAFIFNRCGEKGLRHFIGLSPKTKEEIAEAIDAMKEVGLTQVAEILKEYLPDAPPDSQVFWCTYDEHRHLDGEDPNKCYWYRQKKKCVCREERQFWIKHRAKYQEGHARADTPKGG